MGRKRKGAGGVQEHSIETKSRNQDSKAEAQGLTKSLTR